MTGNVTEEQIRAASAMIDQWAVEGLVRQGLTEAEARQRVERAAQLPFKSPLPSFDEL